MKALFDLGLLYLAGGLYFLRQITLDSQVGALPGECGGPASERSMQGGF